MINGIDLLFAVIGFILIIVAIEIWDRYRDWYEWDRARRRQRKYFRYEFQDALSEMNYRTHLRLIFRLRTLTTAFGYMTTVTTDVSRSFENIHKALRGETNG